MILLIDNYDSFTFNLAHLIGGLGEQTSIRRNDEVDAATVAGEPPDAIIISPGPGAPDGAGACLEIIAALDGAIPMLGVCLGHQAIGQAYGAQVSRAQAIMHGKTSAIGHAGRNLFADIANPLQATRYHSLALKREAWPDCLTIEAETEDGEIMALAHRRKPLYGVQFHPESIATPLGAKIVENFLHLARDAKKRPA